MTPWTYLIGTKFLGTQLPPWDVTTALVGSNREKENKREGLGPCRDTASLTISALCVFLIRNGLTTDKPAVTEDVNIYQKYIAR